MEPIICNQKFSRKGLAYLWNHRESIDATQLSIISSLYNNRKKGSMDGEQSITYKLSNKKAGKLGYGRYYGNKGSLETLEKEARGTLCKDFYHDLDIVNCHPVLLVQFAKSKYNKDLPELEYYCENRDIILKKISDNRDDAKTEIIRILYGGKNKHDITSKLSEEIKTFCKFLSKQKEYEELLKVCKEEDNIYGTFLSFVLQTEERHCMLSMKKYLESINISVDVLCYDGVMIRKNDKYIIDNEFLQNISNAILKDTTYKVIITEKTFSYFEIPNTDTEEIVKGVSKEEYTKMKEEFELNHFYHIPTNQYAEIRDGIMNLYDLQHATEIFNSEYIFKMSDKFADNITFFDLWRKDIARKKIRYVSYSEKGDDIFTLPLTFQYTKQSPNLNPKHIELFEKLLSITCNNNTILKEYVRNYYAHILQKPFDLPGVGLVYTGGKGIGKDTKVNFIMKYVLGEKYSQNYSTNKQFFGIHDTGKQNKFLIKLEEASRKDCLENSEELKAIITATMLTYNPKGSKEYHLPNYGRFIFTTNKSNPVDMSDEERRFVILPVSSEMKGNTQFWNTIYKELYNFEAGRSVAEYLLSIDISNFNPRTLPDNEYQDAVIESEKTDIDFFMDAWNGEELSSNELYSSYKEFCITANLQYSPNSISFGRKLLSYIRSGVLLKNRKGENTAFYSKK